MDCNNFRLDSHSALVYVPSMTFIRYIYLRVRREDGTVHVPLPSWKAGWSDVFHGYLQNKCDELNKSGQSVYFISETP